MSTSKVTSENRDKNNKWTLEQFVIRARKIRSTTLGSDYLNLKSIVEPQITIVAKSSGKYSSRISNIPSESDAALLALFSRPVVLSSEPIHFDVVIKALKSLLRQKRTDAEFSYINILQTLWREEIESPRKIANAKKDASYKSGMPLSEVTDVDLAWHWFYGETFHHDRVNAEIFERFGIKSSFESAYVLVARIALYSIELLEVIEELNESSLIEIDQTAFTKDVRYRRDVHNNTPVENAWIGPVGIDRELLIKASDAELQSLGMERLTIFTYMSDQERSEYLYNHPEEFSVASVNSNLESIAVGEDFIDRIIVEANKLVVQEVTNLNDAAYIFRLFGFEIESDGYDFIVRGEINSDVSYNAFTNIMISICILFEGEFRVQLLHKETRAILYRIFDSEALKVARCRYNDGY